MYSVNRTIGVASTFRASVGIRADVGENHYTCDIRSAVISKGWEEHLTRAGKLFLDPMTSGFDSTFLSISQPRMVFARESSGTLSQDTQPPATETTIITQPDLIVTRLDVPNTDEFATLEFRLDSIALPPVVGSSTTDYNRVYLIGNSATMDYKATPAVGSGGVGEPGVLHSNIGGGETFDPLSDLYLLDADAGAITVDGSANSVWFDRTSILTDPVWNNDVVLAAIDMRNSAIDDVDYDICRGSSTAEVSLCFRIVM